MGRSKVEFEVRNQQKDEKNWLKLITVGLDLRLRLLLIKSDISSFQFVW